MSAWTQLIEASRKRQWEYTYPLYQLVNEPGLIRPEDAVAILAFLYGRYDLAIDAPYPQSRIIAQLPRRAQQPLETLLPQLAEEEGVTHEDIQRWLQWLETPIDNWEDLLHAAQDNDTNASIHFEGIPVPPEPITNDNDIATVLSYLLDRWMLGYDDPRAQYPFVKRIVETRQTPITHWMHDADITDWVRAMRTG